MEMQLSIGTAADTSEYISRELFHFVGHSEPENHEKNFQTLLKVINSGCISANPPEIGWGTTSIKLTRGLGQLESENLVVSNITCYADIPVQSLKRHASKYGAFGLSFSRSMLASYGARPVTYIPMRSDDRYSPNGTTLLRDIEASFEGFMKHIYEPAKENTDRNSRSLGSIPKSSSEAAFSLHSLLIKDFLAFIKPYNSELSEDDINYFYSEREWRRLGNLMFSMEDVLTIVAEKSYISKLRDTMPNFRGNFISV